MIKHCCKIHILIGYIVHPTSERVLTSREIFKSKKNAESEKKSFAKCNWIDCNCCFRKMRHKGDMIIKYKAMNGIQNGDQIFPSAQSFNTRTKGLKKPSHNT